MNVFIFILLLSVLYAIKHPNDVNCGIVWFGHWTMFYDISRFYIFFIIGVLGYVVRVFLVENIIENIFGILYFNLIIFRII